MKQRLVKLSQVKTNDSNPRQITSERFEKLVTSILVLPKMLELRPVVVDSTMVALGGNMRLTALQKIATMDLQSIIDRVEQANTDDKTDAEKQQLYNYWQQWLERPTVAIIEASELSETEQREFVIKDNVGYGQWDWDRLANEWDEEQLSEWGLEPLEGWDDEQTDEQASSDAGEDDANISLSDNFVVPPFSILDTRMGYWRERKNLWRKKIGDLGETREGLMKYGLEIRYSPIFAKTRKEREKLGISFSEYLEKYVSKEEKAAADKTVAAQGVSLFDPVLSEVLCKWFTRGQGDKIFDCFSGDTQKGIVFGYCGREFCGIELRQEQVDVNNKALAKHDLPVRYICDDGRNVAKHFEPLSQDMLFSCPPHFDLEVYSDDERDASNQQDYEGFIKILDDAFKAAYTCLKENRFAVIVVGDVRNKKTGAYYDFCGDIKRIFREAGAHLYNEIILVESIGSNALRARGAMRSRKVAKTHQNVLVFYKGNPREIKNIFPEIEFTDDDLALFDKGTTEENI